MLALVFKELEGWWVSAKVVFVVVAAGKSAEKCVEVSKQALVASRISTKGRTVLLFKDFPGGLSNGLTSTM